MKEAPLGSAPRRAVLHVGTPKSGTTFLQRILWDNHDNLQAQGFRLAGDRQRDMFLAAVELRDSHEFWGYSPEQLAGRWSAVCRQAQEHPGTTILSHEVLGAATDEQVARAMAELEGLEVHLVLTARDLARQVTSEWQERIKNGSSRSFAQFQRQLYRQMRNEDFTGGFWLQQDPTGVLDRWARGLPAISGPRRRGPAVASRPRPVVASICRGGGDRYDRHRPDGTEPGRQQHAGGGPGGSSQARQRCAGRTHPAPGVRPPGQDPVRRTGPRRPEFTAAAVPAAPRRPSSRARRGSLGDDPAAGICRPRRPRRSGSCRTGRALPCARRRRSRPRADGVRRRHREHARAASQATTSGRLFPSLRRRRQSHHPVDAFAGSAGS